MDTEQIWNSVLVEIELAVSKATFNTWFKDTRIWKCEEGIVYLSVPNAFVKDWLFNKYHKTILKYLRNLSEAVRSIEYTVAKDEGKRKENLQKLGLGPAVALPLPESVIDKESNLNPKYTFDAFVVGPFNELAFAAAQAVLKRPGEAYNPFFIYGNTGHGKTHIIQAIGNHFRKQADGRKIYYVTSEKFALDYVNSVQANKVNLFKEKYRRYDVLIMDDIQFLSNKEKTQEELFHLFNVMHEGNKQIVFSSDKHPNFIPNLEDRLKSRFSAGMIVDIPNPDHESRLAILKAKAAGNRVPITTEALEYVASAVEGNIRELEGVLNTIVCQSELRGRELGVAEVRNLIKTAPKPKKVVSVKEVTKAVASFYSIEESDIYEKTRRKEVVKPRQLVMYILRQDFSVSYPLIGQKLGGRDHTTVIHSCEKIKEELKRSTSLEHEINQIRAMI